MFQKQPFCFFRVISTLFGNYWSLFRSAVHHALRHGVINSENLKISIEDPFSYLQGIFDRTRYGLF